MRGMGETPQAEFRGSKSLHSCLSLFAVQPRWHVGIE
jgi:hypothetical protein